MEVKVEIRISYAEGRSLIYKATLCAGVVVAYLKATGLKAADDETNGQGSVFVTRSVRV